MLKLRIEAKVTHRRYGNRRYEDTFETFLNSIIVSTINPHNNNISVRASTGFFIPKKSIDQRVFRIS
jgi:hypothetical protein